MIYSPRLAQPSKKFGLGIPEGADYTTGLHMYSFKHAILVRIKFIQ